MLRRQCSCSATVPLYLAECWLCDQLLPQMRREVPAPTAVTVPQPQQQPLHPCMRPQGSSKRAGSQPVEFVPRAHDSDQRSAGGNSSTPLQQLSGPPAHMLHSPHCHRTESLAAATSQAALPATGFLASPQSFQMSVHPLFTSPSSPSLMMSLAPLQQSLSSFGSSPAYPAVGNSAFNFHAHPSLASSPIVGTGQALSLSDGSSQPLLPVPSQRPLPGYAPPFSASTHSNLSILARLKSVNSASPSALQPSNGMPEACMSPTACGLQQQQQQQQQQRHQQQQQQWQQQQQPFAAGPFADATLSQAASPQLLSQPHSLSQRQPLLSASLSQLPSPTLLLFSPVPSTPHQCSMGFITTEQSSSGHLNATAPPKVSHLSTAHEDAEMLQALASVSALPTQRKRRRPEADTEPEVRLVPAGAAPYTEQVPEHQRARSPDVRADVEFSSLDRQSPE